MHSGCLFVSTVALTFHKVPAASAQAELHKSSALSLVDVNVTRMFGDSSISSIVQEVYPRFDAPPGLMRRGGAADAARLCKMAVIAALVGSLAAVFLRRKLVQKHLHKGAKANVDKEQGGIPSSYPWVLLPSFADVRAAGPTFSSVGTGLQKALLAKGMHQKCRGVTLFGGGHEDAQRNRTVIARSRTAGPKWPLAAQLHRLGFQELALLTLRRASELRKLLNVSQHQPTAEMATGAWLLRHTLAAEDAEGVTQFEGASSLLALWESMPKSTRSSYVAQACLRHPLILQRGHVKVQAFVLALDSGRWFLHRETVVAILDPRQQSLRGCMRTCHTEVWQHIQRSMMLVARHKSLGQKWLQPTQCKPAASPHSPVDAGVLHYQLFVVDFVIDSDKRPWLSDMFPMSEDTTDEGNVADVVRKEVMEDACNLLLSPLLGQLPSYKRKADTIDSSQDTGQGMQTSGFVQIYEPTSGCRPHGL